MSLLRFRSRVGRSGSTGEGKPAGAIAGPVLVTLGVASGLIVGHWLLERSRSSARDSAPGRTARRSRFGDYAVTGRSVTINRPRRELYAFWRDFANLPKFMENVLAVQPTGKDRAVWTIAAPFGRSVDVETEVVEERDGELIAWRSVGGSEVDAEGRIRFSDAPGDRGTVVEAVVAYKPPAGEIGRWIATAFQKEPAIQGRRELKRFKMLMETGEIATSQSHAG